MKLEIKNKLSRKVLIEKNIYTFGTIKEITNKVIFMLRKCTIQDIKGGGLEKESLDDYMVYIHNDDCEDNGYPILKNSIDFLEDNIKISQERLDYYLAGNCIYLHELHKT